MTTDLEHRQAAALVAARRFVEDEVGFAQLTTLDARGYPVTRSMTVFLHDDWQVATVQRVVHRRLAQWERRTQTEVMWIGTPAPGATNEHPHVFDLGELPPRLVAVRGDAEPMTSEETETVYRRAVTEQRARGLTRAPLRAPDEVRTQLRGIRIRPKAIRLEGFGVGAESFTIRIRNQ